MMARSRQQQFACLSYVLMNTGEFTEQRQPVKDSLGIDKLLILSIYFMSSLEYSWVWSWALLHSEARDLLESLSKLVEQRGAVRVYLAFKLVRFLLLSPEYSCECSSTSECTGSTREHTWVPEIASWVGTTLLMCHSHSFVKLAVSCTVHKVKPWYDNTKSLSRNTISSPG